MKSSVQVKVWFYSVMLISMATLLFISIAITGAIIKNTDEISGDLAFYSIGVKYNATYADETVLQAGTYSCNLQVGSTQLNAGEVVPGAEFTIRQVRLTSELQTAPYFLCATYKLYKVQGQVKTEISGADRAKILSYFTMPSFSSGWCRNGNYNYFVDKSEFPSATVATKENLMKFEGGSSSVDVFASGASLVYKSSVTSEDQEWLFANYPKISIVLNITGVQFTDKAMVAYGISN